MGRMRVFAPAIGAFGFVGLALAVGMTGGLALAGMAIIGFAMGYAVDYLGGLMAKYNQMTNNYANDANNTCQEGIPVALAYGTVKIGGNVLRIDIDTDDEYDLIIGHCRGEIESFNSDGTKEWVNDVLWNDLKSNGDHSRTHYVGNRTQTADGRFTDEASAYRSLAYSAYTLKKNDQINSQPTVKIVISGKKCTPIGGGAAVFSRNPAVILYDFLVNVEGYETTDLDTTTFQALETYCNAVPSGGTLARYLFDFVFDADSSINDAKKLIWSAFCGCCFFSQGTIKVAYEKVGSSVHTFTVNNTVKDSISWWPAPKYNVVRVRFIDSTNDYKQDTVEERDNLDIATHGEIPLEVDCFFLTNAELARRRAKFLFNKIRYTDCLCKLTGLPDSCDVELYDVVSITYALAGWTTKQFIVKSRSEDEYGRVTFDLESYNAAIYSDLESAAPIGYAAELLNPFSTISQASSVAITEGTLGDSEIPTYTVTYTKPTNPNYSHSQIYISTDGGSTYTYYGDDYSEGTGYVVDGVKGGFQAGDTVTVKVIAVSTTGIACDDSTAPTDSDTVSSTQQGTPEIPSGLQLVGASHANDYAWYGNSFEVTWRHGSSTGGIGHEGIGQETYGFAGVGLDNYWLEDEVEIWIGSSLIHHFKTFENHWKYTYGDGRTTFIDDELVDHAGAITIKVRRWNKYNACSDYASITLTHADPEVDTPTTQFTGPDCDVYWPSPTDPSYDRHSISVYSDTDRLVLLRTESVRGNHYKYTYAKNVADNSGTPIRILYFTLRMYNVYGLYEDVNFTATNASPTKAGTPVLTAMFKALKITWTQNTEKDIIGYNIYAKTSSPADTLIAFVDGDYFIYHNAIDTKYYVLIKAVDWFGEGTASDEANATTISLVYGDIDSVDAATISTGVMTGIDVQTAASGHRLLIDASDGALKAYDAAGQYCLIDDAIAGGSLPGIDLDDTGGVLLRIKKDATNLIMANAGYIDIDTDESKYALKGECRYITAGTNDVQAVIGYAEDVGSAAFVGRMVGVFGEAKCTNANNSAQVIGVMGYVSGRTGSGDEYSGYFQGANFLVRLGDNAGADKLSVVDSDVAEVASINSNGDVDINGVLDFSAAPAKPKIYSQDAEPNIGNDTFAFWVDTNDSDKNYLILDVGGTQKKVELT